jgi:hypothetical protein
VVEDELVGNSGAPATGVLREGFVVLMTLTFGSQSRTCLGVLLIILSKQATKKFHSATTSFLAWLVVETATIPRTVAVAAMMAASRMNGRRLT